MENEMNNISIRVEDKITAPQLSWFFGVDSRTRLYVDPGIIDTIDTVFGPYWNYCGTGYTPEENWLEYSSIVV